MRGRKLFGVIPTMLIVLLIGLAIGLDPNSVAAGEAKILKVGVSAATTGRAAGWGLATVWGVEQAAEEINEAGGVNVGGQIYKFKVLQYDDKYTISGGKAAGEYLVDSEKVPMVCSLGTMPTIALQEISEAKKVLLFHGCTAAPEKLMGAEKKYTFTHAYGPSEMAVIMFPYLRDQYKVKTIAFISPDTEMGTGFVEYAKGYAEKAGLKIVGYETLNLQLTDFYPVLSKVIKNKPDAIQYCALPLGVDGLVTKQLYELGWKGVKSHSSGRVPEKFVGIAGKEAAENTLLWTLFDFSSPEVPAKTKAFRDRYFAKHKQEPTSLSMRNYSTMYLYAEALRRAGTFDPDKLVAEIEKMGEEGMETLYGKANLSGADFYGINHRIGLPLPLSVVGKNGVVTYKGTINPGL